MYMGIDETRKHSPATSLANQGGRSVKQPEGGNPALPNTDIDWRGGVGQPGLAQNQVEGRF